MVGELKDSSLLLALEAEDKGSRRRDMIAGEASIRLSLKPTRSFLIQEGDDVQVRIKEKSGAIRIARVLRNVKLRIRSRESYLPLALNLSADLFKNSMETIFMEDGGRDVSHMLIQGPGLGFGQVLIEM